MGPLRFAPGIDAAKFAPVFQRFGRLHIPRIFPDEAAVAIGQALAGEATPWSNVFNSQGKIYDLKPDFQASLDPKVRAELDAAIMAGARDGFQFRFDSWRLSDALERGERGGGEVAPIEEVWDFLNSSVFLDFARTLSGDPRIDNCDAQATRYRAGDVLTTHDDLAEGKHRLLAYVLNFTPVWRVDWGGLLIFIDADGHVSEGYRPVFNALNIFKVPQMHAVTQVAPFAGADRLSITGWVRAAGPL